MKAVHHITTTARRLGILLLLPSFISAQTSFEKIKSYIEKHKEYAIEQMALFKIPASVTMAQAIKESGYGTSLLARETNNHFGIKCHKEWGGNTFNMDDDSLNECFRSYNSIEDSFYDHSMFLKSRARYDFLFSLPVTDYFAWCIGLKKAGYATSDNYTAELLYIIEVYNLAELDKIIPLNNSLNYEALLACGEKNIIDSQENYFTNAEKHILAKVIFNLPTEEEPMLVRANSSENKGD